MLTANDHIIFLVNSIKICNKVNMKDPSFMRDSLAFIYETRVVMSFCIFAYPLRKGLSSKRSRGLLNGYLLVISLKVRCISCTADLFSE